MTWDELLCAVNEMRSQSEQVKLGALRHECRRMGLKKFEFIHWSKADVDFLLKNYRTKGNLELIRKHEIKINNFKMNYDSNDNV